MLIEQTLLGMNIYTTFPELEFWKRSKNQTDEKLTAFFEFLGKSFCARRETELTF